MKLSMQNLAYELLFQVTKQNWWYRVRREIVKGCIERYCPRPKGNLKILDVGCGIGDLLKELHSWGEARGIDNSPQAVALCQEQTISNVTKGSATDIPFSDNKFDVVLALDILEHIENDSRAIQEIHRVLQPGGLAIIFVPAFNFLWGKSDELGQHLRRYTLKELKNKMKGRGFRVLKASYFNFFLFLPIWLVRLAVRFFKIPIRSESEAGRLANFILYYIFYLESKLLRFVDFPVGVSAMVIGRK